MTLVGMREAWLQANLSLSISWRDPEMRDYWDFIVDAAQRNVLFWDAMRERGNQFNAHNSEDVANVLDFEFEVLLSADAFERPSNYVLTRIIPPEGTELDPQKPPIVIIDPRAGHGPGIGGFKADSEVGVGFREGHACYVVMFHQLPEDGQTIEDVMKAEVTFIEHVAALHQDAEGKPIIVGNCQGGWALMMLAAYRPDLCGTVIVAGSPLSYWAGVKGKNPMRYSGGLLGGTWLTRLTSDLGAGTFDGAWLVANFEGMNPGNTLWTKQYNLYSQIDTEQDRYLEFEKYWGGYSVLTGEEMQFIVDNLFVGNTLPTGGVTTTDGVRIDYRKIRSPILCFCSWGDNITPPQQALGWILDLYEDVDDIRAHEQTIVYCIHESIGHLGIFVSSRVSRKEQSEFGSNLDFVNVLPPGLYEAVLTQKDESTLNADLSPTDYITSFEPRTLDDIRALGGNELEDELRFATVKKMSEINNSLYHLYAQPAMTAMASPTTARLAREWHPNRMIYRWFSDENPLMKWVDSSAQMVRENRKPVQPGNPFWSMQEAYSDATVRTLDLFRDVRDAWVEHAFLMVFGNPALQATLGINNLNGPPRPRPGQEPGHQAFVRRRIEELIANVAQGGLREAFVRALLFVNLPGGSADERRFHVLKSLIEADGGTIAELKTIIREQFFLLLLDEDAAVAALPHLMDEGQDDRKAFLETLTALCGVGGALSPERADRLALVHELLE